MSLSVITNEWIGTQGSGPETEDPEPDTQTPETRTQDLDRTRRTKKPDPENKICDHGLGSTLHTVWTCPASMIFSYGNIQY